MMMERLSPLIKSPSVRRLSLELCQRLSPNNLILSPPRRKLSVPSPSSNLENSRSLCRVPFVNGKRPRRSSVVSICNVNVIPPTPGREHHHLQSICHLNDKEDILKTSTTPTRVINKESKSRRKSSTSQYDFHEDFLNLVLNKCQLFLDTENVLGRGSFGTVLAGTYQGRAVAVKVIRMKNDDCLKGERNALSLLPHPHIAKVLDIMQLESTRAFILMEKLEKGNLLTVINDMDVSLPLIKIISISSQLASALLYCHQNGILHLDVKPQNILIHSQGTIKLSDFGNSKRVDEFRNYKNFKTLDGTVAYKAPELFRGEMPSEKCDVFSMAITMWQLLTREQPYMAETEHSVIYRVVAQGLRPKAVCTFLPNTKNNSSLTIQSKVVQDYIRIYELCWEGNPHHRPFVDQLMDQLLTLKNKLIPTAET